MSNSDVVMQGGGSSQARFYEQLDIMFISEKRCRCCGEPVDDLDFDYCDCCYARAVSK